VGASAKPVLVDVRVRRTEHGGKSVGFDYAQEENSKVSVKVINLPKIGGVIPCFLASVNENGEVFNLLIGDDGRVLTLEGDKLVTGVLNSREVEGVGLKARTVLDVINSKGRASISYLFNSLNYSFQDVNLILKELRDKDLIKVEGSVIISNSSTKWSGLAWKVNTTNEVLSEKLPVFKNSINSVKSSLEGKGLIVNSVVNVYVK
jgi:hypothetical protein